MNNTLYIIRGVPGTGKSSFYRNMFPNIFHVENDMFHYHNNEYKFSTYKQKEAIEWCTDMVTLSLKKGMDCVVSNTFTQKRFIDSYVKIAKSFDADVEIYRMMGNFENVHDVPKNILESMRNNFEDYEGEKMVYPIGKNDYQIVEKIN